eukprot:SAG11_NODE_610_length_8221_cov_4.801650_2_plen_74_part_00
MGSGKHRTKDNMKPKTPEGKLGDKILKKTVGAINILMSKNPRMKWYMENPVGLMRYSPFLNDLPPNARVTVMA